MIIDDISFELFAMHCGIGIRKKENPTGHRLLNNTSLSMIFSGLCDKILTWLSQHVWTTTPSVTINQELKLYTYLRIVLNGLGW